MAAYDVAALSRLIEQFERMPGVGHKSAQRMAFYVLDMPQEEAEKFARTITDVLSAPTMSVTGASSALSRTRGTSLPLRRPMNMAGRTMSFTGLYRP